LNCATDRAQKLFVFYCSNSFESDEINSFIPAADGNIYNTISLPCSGKVDLLYMIKAFETGADGIVLLICPRNECHYLEGNLRAPKRAEKVNSLLKEIGLTNDRLIVFSKNNDDFSDIISGISEFSRSIKGNMLSTSAAS
jgi:coenzyme F420-reducing hydrogenase delta subunit